jgi:uncharacterized protein YjbI with pentapeptide repeats
MGGFFDGIEFDIKSSDYCYVMKSNKYAVIGVLILEIGEIVEKGTKHMADKIEIWTPQLLPKGQEKFDHAPKKRMKSFFKRWIQIIKAFFVIIPTIGLVVGGAWKVIQYYQDQRKEDVRIAQQTERDRQNTLDQERQATLQNYLDHMSDLLLKNNLNEVKSNDVIARVATAQTLTALKNLDGTRKGILVRFLYESDLINDQASIINLSSADLSSADLSTTHMNGFVSYTLLGNIDLSMTDLSNANLSTTDLSNANISNAFAIKPNLSRALLSGANLYHSILFHANLSSADLSNANLTANMENDDMSSANMRGAYLSYALLGNTKMNNTDLTEANLTGADLRGANLYGAILTGANLHDAKYNTKVIPTTDEQGNPITMQPTQWPKGFNPKAAGAICVDCKKP